MKHLLSKLSLALVLLSANACAQDPAQMSWKPGEKPLHVYITNGDNLSVIDWPPLDSQATIAAAMERLAKTYKAKRIYWRGEALRLRTDNFLIRKDNPRFYDLWMWTKHMIDDVKINQIAVAEAKKNGMEVWMSEGIFDQGAPADTGGTGFFPYQLQSKLGLEHPDWVSVDRWGERANSGTLEFCYPEARKVLIDEYVGLAKTYGYDGMFVYTYVENYGSTYPEEYGFNEPIVAEFKKRYGVDIRTQPFDTEKWYALRGEYVTQFLKELHTALNGAGKKLSVGLYPPEPGFAPPWPLTSKNPRGQQAKMDWQEWIKQNAVDEIATWYGGDPRSLIKQIQTAIGGKNIPVRMFVGQPFATAYKPTIESGATPTPALMPGSSLDRYSFADTNAGSLRSSDWMVRAQALLDVATGKVKVSNTDVAKLVADPHVLVRREALNALAALKASDQTTVIEGALNDPEVAVRIAAADALGSAHGPNSAIRAIDSLGADAGFQEKEAVLKTLRTLRDGVLPSIYEGFKSGSDAAREVCARALELETSLPTTNALAEVALNDPSPRVRSFAALGVINRRNGNAYQTMLKLLDDPEPVVQMSTADRVDNWYAGTSPQQQKQMLDKLESIFQQFGKDSTRPDRDWGWRIVGNAMAGFGQEGKGRLTEMMTKREDPFLAWYAYEILYHPLVPHKESNIAVETVIANHMAFAPPFPGKRWVSR